MELTEGGQSACWVIRLFNSQQRGDDGRVTYGRDSGGDGERTDRLDVRVTEAGLNIILVKIQSKKPGGHGAHLLNQAGGENRRGEREAG